MAKKIVVYNGSDVMIEVIVGAPWIGEGKNIMVNAGEVKEFESISNVNWIGAKGSVEIQSVGFDTDQYGLMHPKGCTGWECNPNSKNQFTLTVSDPAIEITFDLKANSIRVKN